MGRHPKDANNSNPAQPEERSRVASTALAELGDPRAKAAEESVAPDDVLPIPPGYEENIAGCLSLVVKGVAFGLARAGLVEMAGPLLDNADSASESAAGKIATLLAGRAAAPIMWGGLVSAFLGLPLKNAARAAIVDGPAPKPHEAVPQKAMP